MMTLQINGLRVSVDEGTTLLEAVRFLGFPIPTLCHMDGLSPYGACRLCVVEIGEGPKAKLVSSCTYPAQEGLKVRTASARVVRSRKMVLELLLASCPQSKSSRTLRRPTTSASSASARSTKIASSAGCAYACARSR
ncbi:MAG: 2Fe-2S iron-sulfur cluster-binding protein [Planctomycetota bacterium]